MSAKRVIGTLQETQQTILNFQVSIEEHIPHILQLGNKGKELIEVSEENDCVRVEDDLLELHRYCREVIARLDRYHKRLLRIMNEPQPLDTSLFEDTDISQMNWWDNYRYESSSSRNSSPAQLSDRDRSLATPRSHHSARLNGSNASHSGRATPESLEWDLYDISQSELETKDNGALTDDDSIPEMSPLETAQDDIPLLHISRESVDQISLNRSRRSHDQSTSREIDIDDLSSSSASKKPRPSHDDSSQHRTQFTNDLFATLAWLDATEKVTDQERTRSEEKFDKTIEELHQETRELRGLQKSIDQRKPIVLSINLVSSGFIDSDITIKLTRMNEQWESLQRKSVDWNKSMQESVANSQEFQSTINDLSSWIDNQNRRRDDINLIQHRDNADSSPSVEIVTLRRNHRALDQIRIETLEGISKITTMQEICNQLTLPLDSNRGLSDKVRSINGRLRSLLEAVRSDLREFEHKIKETRRRSVFIFVLSLFAFFLRLLSSQNPNICRSSHQNFTGQSPRCGISSPKKMLRKINFSNVYACCVVVIYFCSG